MRSLLFLLICTNAMASVEKRCSSSANLTENMLYVSMNNETPPATIALNEMAQKNEAKVIPAKSGEVGFQCQPIKKGDCFLASPDEKTTWTMEGKKRELVPAVFFRKEDGAKLFALLDDKTWNGLVVSKHRESSTSEVMNFRGKHRDLVIVYVICPPKRDSACEMTIKSNGRWVMDGGKKFSIPVHARAGTSSPKQSLRLHVGGDTPQGIYYLWASMYSTKGFGGEPRIDLEAAMPPVNSNPFDINSYVLSELVPDASHDDYWMNEWPLAYKLGRLFLRIHGRSDGTVGTEGCINTGTHTRKLLNKLEELGLFTKEAIAKVPPTDPSTLGWKVSPRLGKAFLIVKDRDK